MDILKEVLSEIKPGKKDKRISLFIDELNNRIAKNKIDGKAVLGGSFAKNTFLKDNYDIDIFVRFDKKYIEQDISGLLEKCLKGLNYERVHGSRDYFKIQNEFNFEIVPVINIKRAEDARNVTDMSPMHVDWVKKNGKNLSDDIILLKQFCKSAGVYGAESYIQGFSGHVIDILTIYYGSFENVLRSASKWKDKEVIDYYNYHKGKAMWNINKSKLNSPLIVVDPIMPGRNAAAALSKDKFDIFIKKSREYLKKPSKKFFVINLFDEKKFKGFIIEFKSLKGKEDVSGAKIMKVFDFVIKEMDEFGIVEKGWEWDKKEKGKIWFRLKEEKIEPYFERRGPPIEKKKDFENFISQHKEHYTKKGIVFAKVKRNFFSADEKIKYLISCKYVTEKVKCIRLLN